LFSGGIDSYVGNFYLKNMLGVYPTLLYFDLNSRYTKKELKYIEQMEHISTVIVDKDLQFLGDTEQEHNAHIPFRNLYMAMTAAARYSDSIWICGLKDDVMTDKNEAIFSTWSHLLSGMEGRYITVRSPFWQMTKESVVKWFVKQHSKEILLETVSCYSDTDEQYCGSCQACFRKACALFAVDIRLPFTSKSIMNYYRSRIGKNIYDSTRETSMSRYLQFLEEG
jgi:7-cyano-7-deazaguanine synthase in queuosine biosynthesis